MASIVGTPLAVNDGTSYTAEAGSNRVVAVIVGVEEVNSVTFAPTFGGVAFVTPANGFIEGSDRSYGYVGYILEANIPVGSQAFALNPSAAVDETHGTIYTLQDVNQSSPVTAFQADSPAATTRTLNITGVADGVAVAIFEHEATSVITADGDWTTQSLNVGTAHKVYSASKTTTAGADTFDPSTAVSVDGILIAGVFNNVAAGGLSIPVAQNHHLRH